MAPLAALVSALQRVRREVAEPSTDPVQFAQDINDLRDVATLAIEQGELDGLSRPHRKALEK